MIFLLRIVGVVGCTLIGQVWAMSFIHIGFDRDLVTHRQVMRVKAVAFFMSCVFHAIAIIIAWG